MANSNRPEGLKPYKGVLRATTYEVDSSAGNILIFDPVTMEADGKVVAATAGSNQKLLGTALGYHATGSAGTIVVADHPDQLFVIQDDGDSATITEADVGRNADFVSTDTANALVSAIELDTSTLNTTATLQLRVLGKVGVDSDTQNEWGDNVKLIVKINYHQLDNTTGI